MKILREDTEIIKEDLPVSFVTDYISKGWEEVGYLKEASAAIKMEYTNTAKVEQSMQDLMDAYLIFIGQLEAYLNDKEDITAVDEAEVAIQAHELPEAEIKISPIKEPAKEVEIEEPIEADFEEESEPEAEEDIAPIKLQKEDSSEAFDFFVDFDEPDLTEPHISEEDLYGEADEEQEYNKLRAQLRD